MKERGTVNRVNKSSKRALDTPRGFTLIEVILVLGVGSLIFAMAFIAYGQASINRRDTQRRADLGKIASELENYASDNNGKYPTYTFNNSPGFGFDDFKDNYIPTLKDPSSNIPYKDTAVGTFDDNSVPGTIQYDPEVWWVQQPMKMCDETELPNPSNRDYVIRMKLEKGVACRDSKQ